MARTDTLANFVTDIADSIREKTGKTDKIPAASFDTEIANIPSGDTTNEDALILRNKLSLNEYSNNRVKTVGQHAFHGMSYLKNVSLPNVTTVDASAFQGICYSGQDGDYTVIDLPKATTLGYGAFDSTGGQYNAGYLKYNLPEALSFGNRCFGYTNAITHINPKDETATRFVYAPKIQSIGDSCFTQSTHLTYADLKNVTSIGSYAFGGTRLKTLILRGEQVCTLGGTLGSSDTNIYVPANLIEDYKSSTNWSNYAEQIRPISSLNNILDLSQQQFPITTDGNITVDYDAESQTFTLNGTIEESHGFNIPITQELLGTYTLSYNNTETDRGFYISIDNNTETMLNGWGTNTKTFTLTEQPSQLMFWFDYSDSTPERNVYTDYKINLVLEKGENE